MSFAHKIRVGVLRGGPSPEYEVSLNTGKTILANLPEEYEPLDILVTKNGVWHQSGFEKNSYDILKSVDVVINAMHGTYGEDGTVQKILEDFGVPFTGSGSLSSALGMNKVMSKNVFNKHGLKTPHHIVVEKNEAGITREIISKINEKLVFPIILKPVNSGSSLGVSFVENIGQVKEALKNSFKHSPQLLVEEYIIGKEATCGVIEGFRGQDFYTLLPVEVMNVKYQVPSSFRADEKKQIEEATILIHQILGLRHYSRADFILHPKRGLFTLEVNTLPELTHRSSFIKSLEATGSNIREFLSHLISKTLKRS